MSNKTKINSEKTGQRKQAAGKTITHIHPSHGKILGLVRRVAEQLASKRTERKTVGNASMMVVSVGSDGKPVVTETKMDSNVVVPRQLVSERDFAKTILGKQPIRAVVAYQVSVAGSGAAALNSVWPIAPATTSGWSAWSGLFDEARCLSSKIGLSVAVQSSVGSTPVPAVPMWACAYDPTDSTVFGSILDPITQHRFIGPCPLTSPNGTTAGVSAFVASFQNISNKGLVYLDSGRMMTSQIPTGSATVGPLQGDWFSTSMSTPIAGWFKFYGETPGASLAYSVVGALWITMEFKFQG